jgi:hypothetical protein
MIVRYLAIDYVVSTATKVRIYAAAYRLHDKTIYCKYSSTVKIDKRLTPLIAVT